MICTISHCLRTFSTSVLGAGEGAGWVRLEALGVTFGCGQISRVTPDHYFRHRTGADSIAS